MNIHTGDSALLLLKQIKEHYKNGTLKINRLKDPNTEREIHHTENMVTYENCKEVINHYRDAHGNLNYSTIELSQEESNFYLVTIREYIKLAAVATQKKKPYSSSVRTW